MAFSSLPVKELPSFASYRVALRRGFLRVSFSWLLIGSFESDSQSGASVRRALESCRVFTLYFFFFGWTRPSCIPRRFDRVHRTRLLIGRSARQQPISYSFSSSTKIFFGLFRPCSFCCFLLFDYGHRNRFVSILSTLISNTKLDFFLFFFNVFSTKKK